MGELFAYIDSCALVKYFGQHPQIELRYVLACLRDTNEANKTISSARCIV